MINFVIRTDEDKARLIAAIKMANWSFKVYLQPMFPKATPDQYKYLFGVVYQRIVEFSGYTNVWAVHEDMMILFNVEYSPLPDGKFEFRRKGGDEFTTVSIGAYIQKIRAYFHTTWELDIEDDHEIIANE